MLEDYDNLYEQAPLSPELQIKTHYEGLDIAQSNRIHYLKFILPESPLPDIDKQLHEVLKAHEESIERRDWFLLHAGWLHGFLQKNTILQKGIAVAMVADTAPLIT